jgi:hypothetical protein
MATCFALAGEAREPKDDPPPAAQNPVSPPPPVARAAADAVARAFRCSAGRPRITAGAGAYSRCARRPTRMASRYVGYISCRGGRRAVSRALPFRGSWRCRGSWPCSPSRRWSCAIRCLCGWVLRWGADMCAQFFFGGGGGLIAKAPVQLVRAVLLCRCVPAKRKRRPGLWSPVSCARLPRRLARLPGRCRACAVALGLPNLPTGPQTGKTSRMSLRKAGAMPSR